MLHPTFLRTVWAIIKKDVTTWFFQPASSLGTVLPALAVLLVGALLASAVGRSPVALVVLDSGPPAQQLAQSIRGADVFRLTETNPRQALALLKDLDVVAVITIPADFTRRYQAHEPDPVLVEVDNLNLDFTNDVRRAVPDAVTQFYRAQGSSSPIAVTVREQDLRAHDVDLFQYQVLPTIVLLLTIGGVLTSGMATAREWESQTVKELLLSPSSRSSLIVGKVLAGSLTTFALGLVVLGVGYILGWTRPEGVYWLSTLLIMILIALLSSGLGVALGALLKRILAVLAVSIFLGLYLFFLAGGMTVLAFEPDWLQAIAAFDPLTYGTHALQMAIFYSSSDLLGRDVAILALSALAAICLGILAMRRSLLQ
jgi:ABC-2 type transport system permease protein